jgi:hypothetical protein
VARSSEPLWPHRQDFGAANLPRPTLADELALGRAMLSDHSSATNILETLAAYGCATGGFADEAEAE